MQKQDGFDSSRQLVVVVSCQQSTGEYLYGHCQVSFKLKCLYVFDVCPTWDLKSYTSNIWVHYVALTGFELWPTYPVNELLRNGPFTRFERLPTYWKQVLLGWTVFCSFGTLWKCGPCKILILCTHLLTWWKPCSFRIPGSQGSIVRTGHNSKNLAMASTPPTVVNTLEVPHFELNEDPAFWMGHNVQVWNLLLFFKYLFWKWLEKHPLRGCTIESGFPWD